MFLTTFNSLRHIYNFEDPTCILKKVNKGLDSSPFHQIEKSPLAELQFTPITKYCADI